MNMLKMQARVKIEDKQRDIVTYHDYPVEQLKFKRAAKPDRDEKDEDLGEEIKEILD